MELSSNKNVSKVQNLNRNLSEIIRPAMLLFHNIFCFGIKYTFKNYNLQ